MSWFNPTSLNLVPAKLSYSSWPYFEKNGCVCVCVCMYNTHTHTHTHTHTCIHTQTHTNIYVKQAAEWICWPAVVLPLNAVTIALPMLLDIVRARCDLYLYVCIYTRVCVCVCMCASVCLCVCMSVCLCVYAHACSLNI